MFDDSMYVWMGIESFELRKKAFLSSVSTHYGERRFFKNITYTSCPLCGKLHWISSGVPVQDPGDPEDVFNKYADEVKIVLSDEGCVCNSCSNAYSRSPEVMDALFRMVRLAVFQNGQKKND